MPPNNPGPPLDPAKFLLQQLAGKAAGAPAHALQQKPFIPHQPPISSPTYPGAPQSLTNGASYPGPRRMDSGYNRFDVPSNGGYERTDFHDKQRKGFRREQSRGGHFAQGHGREDRPIGRHEERERYRREDDREPFPNKRYNRSQSPASRRTFDPRESRREIRPYSPPGRPSLAAIGRDSGKRASPPREPGKDEFGRDIRSPSQEPNSAPEEHLRSETRRSAEESLTPLQDPTTSTNLPTGNESSAPKSKSGGLETFNFSLFNPTDPASWKALGDAFEVTNGYLPSQEELMQVIMAQMMSMGMGMDSGFMGVPNQSSAESSQEYGSASYSSWNDGLSNMESTDVGQAGVVKGQADIPKTTEDEPKAAGTGSAGGHMQKVGDGWVFVRGDTQS